MTGLFIPSVPTRPPDDINIEEIGPTALMMHWRPPNNHPNGIIRRYVVRLTELETGRQEQFVTNSTTITISNRHPFYRYSSKISAETVGQGPFSKPVLIQMPEAGKLDARFSQLQITFGRVILTHVFIKKNIN